MDNTFIDMEDLHPHVSLNAYREERNSLRRFLAGLTATTLGVLTALHPQGLSSKSIGLIYVCAVLSNAISTIFFMASAFGRVKELKKKAQDDYAQNTSQLSGREYEPVPSFWVKRFSFYSTIAIVCYICSIILMCTYVVLEMLYI